jgi:hypothetical protein
MPDTSLSQYVTATERTEVLPAAAPAADTKFVLVDRAAFVRDKRIKTSLLVTGLVFTTFSAAAQGVSYALQDTSYDALSRNLRILSYTGAGVGFLTLLTGIIYNPPLSSR